LRNARTLEPSQQLFCFAREHGSRNNLDPSMPLIFIRSAFKKHLNDNMISKKI
jgi:hypothetical protein